MSNVKNSYNGIRRIRKGYKERLILFVLKRPLRDVAIATTDEYIIENYLNIRKFELFYNQEINIIRIGENKNFFQFLLPYPKPTQVR